jgi:hypothetical protein
MLRSRSSRRSRRCSVHRRGNQPDRSLRGYTSGAARGAGWTGLPPFLETVRNRRPRSSFHALHESPPFDGLSANRGGEIRTRDLLNPIQARYRAAPRPDAESCGLLRGSAGLQTANPAQIPPNLAHNVAHWCGEDPRFRRRRYVSAAGNATARVPARTAP